MAGLRQGKCFLYLVTQPGSGVGMWAWVWPGLLAHNLLCAFWEEPQSNLTTSGKGQQLEMFAIFIVIYPALPPHCAWGPTVGAVPHVHVAGVSGSSQCLPHATRR